MPLREFQQEAVEALYTYFETHPVGNPIIAMPTGTGKSYVIGGFIQSVMQQWPNQRVLMLTHVKELIQQNAARLIDMWPTAPLGVYSAGLERKEIAPITYAGIGSVYRNAAQFAHVDLVIVDEAHLLGDRDDSMYRTFLAALREVNPSLRVIGLTATPYRLGQGMLTDGEVFTDVAFDNTQRENFTKLIKQGYLAPLVPKQTRLQLDVSNVSIRGGEYVLNQLQQAVDREAITYQALVETMHQAADRKCWLVFTTGVDHTEHVADMLNNDFDIPARAVHSRLTNEQRDRYIDELRTGAVRCLVNNNVLTTGFDHAPIDLIAVLRHTASPGLWVQMLGRGTRPAPGKDNCLVLDFAGNTQRLGPINDPVLPVRARKGAGSGTAPVRVCESCLTYNHASATHCVACGADFPRLTRFGARASTAELIARPTDEPEIVTYTVRSVSYQRHTKQDRPPSVKVTYYCGLHIFHEWVCVEHTRLALHRAHVWWRLRFPYADFGLETDEWVPSTVEDALRYTQQLRLPTALDVWVNRKHPEIVGYHWGSTAEALQDERRQAT